MAIRAKLIRKFSVHQTLFVISFLCHYCQPYNTSSSPVDGKVNVHLVPHTHDDVGWLKTLDQYYIGSNNSIQVASVQYILDSVIEKLIENPDRKFIYVEQAFFQRWWRQQSLYKRDLVRKLVKSGQFEFINGGWCMHDEATTSFIDMIDQMSLGHRFVKRQFKKVPRISWQIDPFGHSAVQGYLFSADSGFDAIFFARADWQDLEKRRKTKTMEFIWRGSESLGSSAQVFGGMLHHHYEPPEGFMYDIQSSDPPIQDDPFLFDINVDERVEAFVKIAFEQANQFRTNHIMWTMGDDFSHSNAQTWFKNMDKLIHYVNKDGRVNALYSTPSQYLDCKFAANETWPLKTGDFFPYSNNPHNFWTGFFSSRPSLKGYVRSSSALLQASRQLEAMVGKVHCKTKWCPSTDELEEAVATAQHHDAVTGTSKQHVADDYAKRLYLGEKMASVAMNRAIVKLMMEADSLGILSSQKKSGSSNLRTSFHKSTSAISSGFSDILKLKRCGLLNISVCETSEQDLSHGSVLVVVAYNPLGWPRKEFVKIPVSSLNVVVQAEDELVDSQILPIGPVNLELRKFYAEAHEGRAGVESEVWDLVFEVELPPLGFKSYTIKKAGQNERGRAHISQENTVFNAERETLDLGSVSVQFSTETGALLLLENKNDNVSSKLEQGFFWYNASNGIEAGPQPSGAYIFRPNSSKVFPVEEDEMKSSFKVIRGPLVNQIHRTTNWASQVVSVYKNSEHVEFNFMVGPVPINDGFGKEVISQILTDIRNNKTFFTDSNGRDYLKRIIDHRDDWEVKVTDPIAGNFYPVTAGMYFSDGERQLSVLVDRSVSGSVIRDGQAQLMLHRRLLYDDNKGVGEHLNETVCVGNPPICHGLAVAGKYFVGLHSKASGSRWRRKQTQKNFFPLQLSFAKLSASEANVFESSAVRRQFSAVREGFELPPNVALITLQELDDTSVLLRLAHLFEVGEDEEYSSKVTLDLQSLFPTRTFLSVSELSLTGNQLKSTITPLQWKLDKGVEVEAKQPERGRPHEEGSTEVELGPMEIRTFSLKFA